jgi:hypothetical protein
MKYLNQTNTGYSKIISIRDLESKIKSIVVSPRTKIVNESLRKEKL